MDMQAPRPLAQFRRVARTIRERITAGTYPVGSRLPSIAALAEDFATSHMTIKQALATLAAEGVIASRRGVTAEVLAIPGDDDEPPSVSARLVAVEAAVAELQQRVASIEDHGSKPTR